MPANDRIPPLWSRRSVLLALAFGPLAASSGCQLRLEDDAPRIPGLPTRSPIPDEQALLQARREALRLKLMAEGLESSSTPLTRRLATIHRLQANVLESVLRSGGVPPAEITSAASAAPPSPTPTAGAASTPSISAPKGIPALISAEAEGVAAGALLDLAGISPERTAVFGAMAAQRATAVRLLGGRLPSSGPLTGLTGEVAAGVLDAIRSAVYGFEVVAAHADPSRRKAAASTLGMLRSRSSELEVLAGPAAGPTPLGYALPFPVTNPASALRLATHLMTALRQGIAARLPGLAGDAAGLTGAVWLLADVSLHAVTWRVPLTAFPGLTNT